MNKIKRRSNFDQLSFQLNTDIVDLRFKMIINLSSMNISNKSNINLVQFKTIQNFNKTKPFKVIDTDKKLELQ